MSDGDDSSSPNAVAKNNGGTLNGMAASIGGAENYSYPQTEMTLRGSTYVTLDVMDGFMSSTEASTTAVTTAKKAADHFNREWKARALAVQEQKKKVSEGKMNDTDFSFVKAGALSFGAMFTAIIQAAVQIVSSIISVLTMILVPLAIIAMVVSFTVSLLTGIGGAVDEAGAWYMGGGMELVEVATKEIDYKEGADGSTKYGTWAGIGNASWCHAFVSWCANECGFIEEEIIPKTGSCEEGRQWFITRNEYQERGSYEPAPGDIVYFRHGDETVSHHVGIVEYAENGILHTIEGNSGGVVKRREYPLNANRIMGYGLPSYPDDGYGEFGSTNGIYRCRLSFV